MAITKIKPVKSGLKKALEYIQNPDKTDDKMLVSSFGCGSVPVWIRLSEAACAWVEVAGSQIIRACFLIEVFAVEAEGVGVGVRWVAYCVVGIGVWVSVVAGWVMSINVGCICGQFIAEGIVKICVQDDYCYIIISTIIYNITIFINGGVASGVDVTNSLHYTASAVKQIEAVVVTVDQVASGAAGEAVDWASWKSFCFVDC